MIDLTKLVTAKQKTDAAVLLRRQIDNAVNQAYLDDTDWMILRQTETGKVVPQDIAAKRQLARSSIVKSEVA